MGPYEAVTPRVASPLLWIPPLTAQGLLTFAPETENRVNLGAHFRD